MFKGIEEGLCTETALLHQEGKHKVRNRLKDSRGVGFVMFYFEGLSLFFSICKQ